MPGDRRETTMARQGARESEVGLLATGAMIWMTLVSGS
jgi:hypothetical protein